MSGPTRGTSAGRAYLDLQNRARREKRGTQELLTMYIAERWWERLSRSPYSGDFVLKGGMLLAAFGHRRATADTDALARNLASDTSSVLRRVVDVATIHGDDGVEFLTETAAAAVIRDDALYAGVRVTMATRLATAVVKLRLDINFGDPVTPAPESMLLPALRPGDPAIPILGYPVATVLAEKLVTAIDLGPANTRVRDFVDAFTLIQDGAIDPQQVRRAVQATSAFRGVTLVPLSEALGDFATTRAAAYAGYRRNLGVGGAHLAGGPFRHRGGRHLRGRTSRRVVGNRRTTGIQEGRTRPAGC